MEIKAIVQKYLDDTKSDEFHRYKSWNRCYQSFSETTKDERHILELAFYLASWGMYRGSSGLLQKNHLIHKGAVDILFSNMGQKLKCNRQNEVNRSKIAEIITLKENLSNHYRIIKYKKGREEEKQISPTDTLISKILLGTLCCVPAYDVNFITGLKENGIKKAAFTSQSLDALFDFINKNSIAIKEAQELISQSTGQHYPVMKIVDIYFWQIGNDKISKEKPQEKA